MKKHKLPKKPKNRGFSKQYLEEYAVRFGLGAKPNLVPMGFR